MRDYQQGLVYAAEQHLRALLDRVTDGTVRAFGTTWVPETEVLFSGPEDVQRYVDRVLAHIGCERPIRVRPRKGSTKAHYEPLGSVIALAPRQIGGGWSLREIVVLHEIAHHLTPRGASDHGPEFASTFLQLLRDIGCPVQAYLLQICLHEEGAVVGS